MNQNEPLNFRTFLGFNNVDVKPFGEQIQPINNGFNTVKSPYGISIFSLDAPECWVILSMSQEKKDSLKINTDELHMVWKKAIKKAKENNQKIELGFELKPVTLYLDIETTGLNATEDEILEIALTTETGQPLINTLIKPALKKSWPEAEKINNITPEMASTAPSLLGIIPAINALTSGQTVKAWNAPFDLGFLRAELSQANVICAMQEYGQYIEKTQPQNKSKSGRYKLADVAKQLGVKIEGDPHRALTDVKTMMEIRRIYLHPSFNRTDLNGSVNTEGYKENSLDIYTCSKCEWKGTQSEKLEKPFHGDFGIVDVCPKCEHEYFYKK